MNEIYFFNVHIQTKINYWFHIGRGVLAFVEGFKGIPGKCNL